MNDSTARTAHLADAEAVAKAVAYAAARAAKTIDHLGAPGHGLATVMARMTSDKALDTMRRAYAFRISAGDGAREAADKVGLRMVHAYRDQYGI